MVLRSLKASQNLSEGPMLEEFEFSRAGRLATVYVHSNIAITETVEVSFISAEGENFNTYITSEDLVDQQDYVYAASGEVAFNEGDKIRVEVTDANHVGRVFATVKLWA